ncbi:hypothetical protein [Accumulibacter sp.]|uniref:hypothetical protein n=1 Tax=Accumulibacter sp. TaxID=2053492 RepID=UPI0028C44C78|nr:hypothetical protein [Accumulibacter sp.]
MALPVIEPQAALADLYSAAILLLSALYSSFDMPDAAIAPVLKAKVIAAAMAVILILFMVVPSWVEL